MATGMAGGVRKHPAAGSPQHAQALRAWPSARPAGYRRGKAAHRATVAGR